MTKPTTGYAADASCRAPKNTIKNDGYFHGRCEFQVVDISSGEYIHRSEVFEQGTVNLAEFLGIYWALRILHDKGDTTTPVWSDSQVAIGWFAKRRIRSKMPLNEFTYEIIDAADEGIEWIKKHNPPNPVMKWMTHLWGDVPADYGRK